VGGTVQDSLVQVSSAALTSAIRAGDGLNRYPPSAGSSEEFSALVMNTAACVLLAMPSFLRMVEVRFFTVFSASDISWLIWRLVSPLPQSDGGIHFLSRKGQESPIQGLGCGPDERGNERGPEPAAVRGVPGQGTADEPELFAAAVLFGQAPPCAGQNRVDQHGFVGISGHQEAPDGRVRRSDGPAHVGT